MKTGFKRLIAFLVVCCLTGPSLSHAQDSRPASAAKTTDLQLRNAVAAQAEEILFCTRVKYDDPHWYANIGYYCDDHHKKAYSGNGNPDDSKLYALNLKSGTKRVLLDANGGSIRDPQLHYDAKKVLFSYRKAGSEHYHLHEINMDGSGLRQITNGAFDDYEPAYLPDGGIVFVSTRCNRWVNCWMTQVGIIYRCDADGRNVEQISANTEHDNTPWVLPDGRILYTRWEYVDRSQVEFHHLWTMNPDGTEQNVYYGNMRPKILMIDAKPVPGSDKIVASFSPGHGVNEHAGIATLVSENKGPDDPSAAQALHRGKLTRDPYALSESAFLGARGKEILAMDAQGNSATLYVHQGEGEVHEPRPILPRPRERVIARRTRPEKTTGVMALADVYNSRNMDGVKRGDIKKLLVLESLPKPVNFSGGPDLTSWLGTFTLERVLGTVPVEEDGSACFEVPANRQIFFVALDKNDLSVKRMQSFTSLMPGEVRTCAGCHEDRTRAGAGSAVSLTALRRAPRQIEPFADFPDVLDFQRDIQPILDRNCVECHRPERRDGKVLLTGDLGPQWSHSFFSLFAFRQVADGRNGLGNQPPRTIGSSASQLLKKIDGSHYAVKVSEREWRTLWLWIESGAPYAGSYGALRNQETQRISGGAMGVVFGAQNALLKRRCGQCHTIGATHHDNPLPLPFHYETRWQARNLSRPTADHERIVHENDPLARFSISILLNFSRPALSPLLLGPLAKEAGGYASCGTVFESKNDPDYRALLAAIEKGKTIIDAEPRFGSPAFKPNPQYVRELKKFGVLPASFDLASDPIDVFAADQRYWKSLWPSLSPVAAR